MRKSLVLAVIFQLSVFNLPFAAQSVDSLVASGDEMLKPRSVGTDDMLPVLAGDIAEGVYEVEAESSSSMFRIAKSVLTVSGEAMSVSITLSGKSYLKLFLGSARDAAGAGGVGEIAYTTDENGAFVFTFPIPALNEAIECAAFSAKKGKWYDRRILFSALSLPAEALFVSPVVQQKVALKNGSYTMNVALSGGSGKAGIKSPAYVTVEDGLVTAEIEWGSANYDYMKVNRVRYDVDAKILDKGGNSTFRIPIFAFDKKIPVTADTNAMSRSHEIHYWLWFDLKSAKKTKRKK